VKGPGESNESIGIGATGELEGTAILTASQIALVLWKMAVRELTCEQYMKYIFLTP
jgi:hypothetical protein